MAKRIVKKAKSKAKTKTKTKAAKKPVKTAKVKAKSYKGLKVGDRVGPLSAPATGGQPFDLKDFAGKNVVLYFYPKDDTPGCTLEGHDFTKLKPQFESHSTVVFGISKDTLESHNKFKEKQCYSVDLISDEDGKICKAFDVIQDKNMYGKIYKGIERSTFVIDASGTLRGEWRKVSVPGHAEAVLEFVRGL
jgi:peroxiredoxin Q/BCP